MHTETSDEALLHEYAETRSDAAFHQLVERHIGPVHAFAYRQTGDAHLAQDIAQAVFLILSRKASSLPKGTVLSGWFFKTTRFVAGTSMRSDRRRRLREFTAMTLNSAETDDPSVWERILPLLNEGMASLRDRDREALLLRYFHERSLREVAEALQLSEDAVQKRISRSVDKLRRFFVRRGVVVPLAVLSGVLAAQAAQPAPAGLAQVVAEATCNGTGDAGAAGLLADHALQAMWASKLAWLGGAAILGTAALITVVALVSRPEPQPTVLHDLARDFSLSSNPNGVWSYGWAGSLQGPFVPMTFSQTTMLGGGRIPFESWQLAEGRIPAIYHNAGSVARTTAQGTAPPGAVWFHPGDNGSPENYAAIRYTVPPGGGGRHGIVVAVEPNYYPPSAGDTDFHVTHNGSALFGEFLPVDRGTGYTNSLDLKEGDTIDFLVGRGADANEFASSLKISASIQAPAVR